MMPVENAFETLNSTLQEFRNFLDNLVATGEFSALKTALQTLQSFVPQIATMLNRVIALLQDLRNEIDGMDIGAIPNVDDAVTMLENVSSVLEAARAFLPGQENEIDEVMNVAHMVSSIPGLTTDLKENILSCIDAIIAHFSNLKAT
jgi:phage-related protein